jgi:glutamine amidotransferase
MQQSERDAEGLMHGHGWGVADYRDGLPLIEKQAWAAFHGEHFRKSAARIYAKTAVAHVRRATVGGTSMENTHPFQHGSWLFAHNGTIPNFLAVRDKMIQHIDPMLQNSIEGDTDSEHIFYYLLSLQIHHTDIALREIIRRGLRQIIAWSNEISPGVPTGLNIVITNGEILVGSRHGRTLWHLVREESIICKECGQSHVQHRQGRDYRAIEVASEPITNENWSPFSDDVIYSIDKDLHFEVEALLPLSQRGSPDA